MRVKCIFLPLKLTYTSYSDLVESISRTVYMTISFSKLNPRSTSLCFEEAQIHGTFISKGFPCSNQSWTSWLQLISRSVAHKSWTASEVSLQKATKKVKRAVIRLKSTIEGPKPALEFFWRAEKTNTNALGPGVCDYSVLTWIWELTGDKCFGSTVLSSG